ncbi:MAG: hypothetical protein E7K27_19875, partial [[Clostridium] symbiosum]|nr:hypothetical protein [[Clostridium] symbiosum]
VCARQLLKPPCTERYARWCERTAVNHRLLLDLKAVTCARSVPVIVNRIAPGMGESVWFMTLL